MRSSLEDFDLIPAEIDVLTFLINNMDKNITASEISMNQGFQRAWYLVLLVYLKIKNN